MSTVNPDTSRETATPLTDGCNNNRIVCIRLTVSVSVLQDVIKIKRLRGIKRLCWKCNCSCVLSRLKNKSSKFYKISSVLNIIMLKILRLCFVVDSLYMILMQGVCRNKRGRWICGTRSRCRLLDHITAVDDRHEIWRVANSHWETTVTVYPLTRVVRSRSRSVLRFADWVVAHTWLDGEWSISRQSDAVVDRPICRWTCSEHTHLLTYVFFHAQNVSWCEN